MKNGGKTMKKMLFVLAVLACALVMTACQSGGQKFEVINNQPQSQPTQNLNVTPTTDVPDLDYDFNTGDYDPTSEEGIGDEDPTLGFAEAPAVVTQAPTVRSDYAGATPVVVNPIDMPTPTVVPPLTFAYQAYDATALQLSFEGPVGWVVDESVANTYTIYNPNPAMDYAAALTIQRVPVTSDYNKSDLKKEVQAMLSSIGNTGFAEFDKSNTAERTLIGHDGIYANYTGTLHDGTKVAGRVHITCIDRVLYKVHITYPRAYTETYKELVYDKLRDTITLTK